MWFRPRAWLAVLLWSLPAGPARAQNGDELDPSLVPRIDSVFRRFGAPGSPGCALGVMRGGKLAYAKGYGLASIELGVPITPATVFDIGSVSKQFTALAVVLLAQDGKLSLDDEIQKYLPEIPRYGRPVTLRHLLHHTSGIRDYIDLLSWSGVQEESVTGDREALEILTRQKDPNFVAGAEFLYSNSGFFLLSVMVRRASGQSLREFAAQRIFGPLGMTHTFYLDRHDEIVPGKAASYAPARPAGFRLALANWEQTGDGAVQTTVEDLLRWDGNFGSGAVGGAAAIRELESTGVLNDGKAIEYALGLNVDTYRGLRRVSHGGSWAGFRAQLTRFPEQRVAISTLCNVANAVPSSLATRVAEVVLGAAFTAPPPSQGPFTPLPGATLSARPLADYAGRYRSDELLADWIVFVASDSLHLRIGPTFEDTLRFGPGGAVSSVGRVQFVEAEGKIVGITLNSRGARNFRLTKVSP